MSHSKNESNAKIEFTIYTISLITLRQVDKCIKNYVARFFPENNYMHNLFFEDIIYFIYYQFILNSKSFKIFISL